ncbi:MAG: DNA internalization-related competence protein ComEC/Rec2 [Geobacteraceae bacterium GWC2_58_44]|nr:MAG: DNA internalization-related competence protein ComEC/Rec2 [Geobacteraceae bacterium GWC2_58_44]HBG05657.1 DNA internalization-related competence protein ComEC/Rec2 [Geobacter sp.]
MERPLLVPLASLIAGLCAADFCGSTPPEWALAALLLTTLAASFVTGGLPFLLSLSLLFFVWGGVSLKPLLEPSSIPAKGIPAGICQSCRGASCECPVADALARFAAESPVLIEGVVDERPVGLASGGGRLFLQVDRLYREHDDTAVTGRLLVQIKEGRAQLCTGDRILFSSKIRKPRSYGIPGEMDHPRQLAYQGVFATSFVKEADDLLLVRAGEGWRHRIDLLAGSLGRFITEQAPVAEGGVLKALLLGDKADVPEELNDAYARSGVNHILSISGFHVGIIFLGIFQMLYLGARGSEYLALHLNLRKALLFAALPVVVFYLFLSGGAPATLRSVLMIAALVAALQLKREVEPVNAVMLAACAILFVAPRTLFDVSFQLSFLAIWGLVALAQPLSARVGRVAGADGSGAPGGAGGVGAGAGVSAAGAAVRWLLLLIVASAAAVLATVVPVAYYFHRISLIGLLANLVIIPLMGYGAVVAGFASLPLILVAPVPAGWLLRFAAFLVTLSDAVILYLARAPVLTGYSPTKVDLLLACLVLCAITFISSRRAGLFAALALVAVLAVRAVPAGGAGDGLLRLVFLSVGQGDATLIGLPDGKWMLLDGGGRAGDTGMRVGQRLLLPALSRLGVGRIDFLVLSHEHPDHLQGVLFLAANFEVGEFWESGVVSDSPEYQQLKWLLAARDIPVRALASHPPFAAGGALVEPLWPLSSLPAASGDANDSSLVLRLRHGKSSVLFTGDLRAEAEGELLALGVPLDCSLLKVAHHGSKYSSTDPFLAAASPKVAVISAGYQNPFRLPAPSTVARLQKRGIRVYRTDLDGSVQAVCRPDGTLVLSTPWGHFN